MDRLKTRILPFGAMVALWTGKACAELISLDLSSSTEKVIESLGTKLVLSALVLGVSAIICTALLRKR